MMVSVWSLRMGFSSLYKGKIAARRHWAGRGNRLATSLEPVAGTEDPKAQATRTESSVDLIGRPLPSRFPVLPYSRDLQPSTRPSTPSGEN